MNLNELQEVTEAWERTRKEASNTGKMESTELFWGSLTRNSQEHDWPSLSVGSASVDSTKCLSKVYGQTGCSGSYL
jgi:hypothetical protein